VTQIKVSGEMAEIPCGNSSCQYRPRATQWA